LGNPRTHARSLANQYVSRGDFLGWFESLYVQANGDPATIPWADRCPNPNLVAWLDRQPPRTSPGMALTVGCGLGDDAEYLAGRGFRVTAFDISATAIAWCRKRYPESCVTYAVHDLFQPPQTWRRAFDLVVEAYTLQVLPPMVRPQAIHQIAEWVSPDGVLLVIARGREPTEPEGEMPWPLTREELFGFERAGLVTEQFEDYLDAEEPPVRRFRVSYKRREGTA
jgi:SAM-dependent methyltransferase